MPRVQNRTDRGLETLRPAVYRSQLRARPVNRTEQRAGDAAATDKRGERDAHAVHQESMPSSRLWDGARAQHTSRVGARM